MPYFLQKLNIFLFFDLNLYFLLTFWLFFYIIMWVRQKDK